MANFFDINTVFFVVWGYPMSYIEFFGTMFNLWCVWLTAKGKISSWPIGLLGVVLYAFLFYQIQLYSDLTEQFYFFVTGLWGWWAWAHPKNDGESDDKKELKVSYADNGTRIISIAAVVLGTVVMGYFMKNIHLYLPKFFTEPASFPYLDAFTTVMSFTATILMIRKKIECWYLWILVDIIGVWLYYTKGVKFISLEYLIFLGLATKGLFQWLKIFGGYTKKEPPAVIVLPQVAVEN
jgi:nicotinamide mononucleotide transporter